MAKKLTLWTLPAVLLCCSSLLLLSNESCSWSHHQERIGCGVTAELRRVKVLDLYNPNELELDYVVTNNSGRSYRLPDTFQALRESSDRILHPDAEGLGFPAERFFPSGRTVEFTVWLDVGNVLDHAPTDSERAELEKHLAGTRFYVLIDEMRGCEVELPVGR